MIFCCKNLSLWLSPGCSQAKSNPSEKEARGTFFAVKLIKKEPMDDLKK